MSPTLRVQIHRLWDEVAKQTAEFRPLGSAAVLVTWTTSPPAIDAGVPAPIVDAVSQMATSLGRVAFRLFFPEDLPAGIQRIPATRPFWPMRVYQRLTHTWPAEIATATDAAGAAELFVQDWQMQGQTALVLRESLPAYETLENLRRSRNWRSTDFPADVRLLIAPAVDGDGILLAAPRAADLVPILLRLRETFEQADISVDCDTAILQDIPEDVPTPTD